MSLRQIPRKLFRLFLQGLLILAPISITIWTVVSVFSWIDNILPSMLHSVFPNLVGIDGLPRRIPGLGFIVFIGIALFVGYISPSFIVSRLVDLADTLLERTPGIKLIYSTIKDFFEAFAGNKRKFDKSRAGQHRSAGCLAGWVYYPRRAKGIRPSGICGRIRTAVLCLRRTSIFCKKRPGEDPDRYKLIRRDEIRHFRRGNGDRRGRLSVRDYLWHPVGLRAADRRSITNRAPGWFFGVTHTWCTKN